MVGERDVHVLCVDDDPIILETVAERLEHESDRITVSTAESARDGLARLDDGIDCVVSDYRMPGMDGVEFRRAVSDDRPDLPFILFTGTDWETVGPEAVTAGITDYMAKDDVKQYRLLAAAIIDAVERSRGCPGVAGTPHWYRTLLEDASGTLAVLDDEGRIRYQSPSVTRILGHDPVELVGEHVFEYVHPDDRQHVEQAAADPVRRSAFDRDGVTCRMRHADGTWRQVELVVVDRSDTVVDGYVVSLHPFADRAAREREGRRLEELVGVVSHDLRSPLQVAKGHLRLAREDCGTEHLETVARAHDRMEELIDDLLVLAREGRSVDEVSPIELADIVGRCWTNVETGGADLTVDSSATIMATESRLAQVFENLFRNAVEHGSTGSHASRDDAVGHGGDGVAIRVGVLDAGFYVEDDGPGIPEDERDEVFEPGYSTVDHGTGLGLNIVERIVEAHGWDIRVTEGRHGGARFEVTGVEMR